MTRAVRAALAQIALAAAWLHVGSAQIDKARLLSYFDTAEYRKIAALPLSHPGFWNGMRPWGMPLLIKYAGSDQQQIKIQIALYALGWLVCARAVASLARSALMRVALFALLLALGLCTDLFYWQKSISSESLSTSLLLLGLGLSIPLFRSPPPSTARLALSLALLAPITVLWIFTRDANGYLLLSLVGTATVVALVMPRARHLLRLTVPILVATMLAVVVQSRSADRSGRWKYCFVNLLSQRVLGWPARREFFVERGLPINPKVMCFAGKWGNSCGGDWSGFGTYLDGNIKGHWARYLMSHPLQALSAPRWHLAELLSAAFKPEQDASTLTFYFSVEEPPWQKRWNLFYFANWQDVRWPVGGALVVAALLALRRRWATRLLLPATVLLAIYPIIFFIWQADAMEPQRHAVLAVMLSRIGLWSAILLGLDVLVEKR